MSTPEPGTCLKQDAYRILQIIENIRANPLEKKKYDKIFDLVKPKVYHVLDTVIREDSLGVPLRIYYPNKKSMRETYPIVFYIHGGAFMYGDIEKYDLLAKKISLATKSIVSSVEYRLAPDHPFPAAIDDSYCALEWVANHAEDLGGSKNGICVMGSSAGGNIATVLTLKSREKGYPNIACQVLYYPCTTFEETEFPSRLFFLCDSTRSYMLTEEVLRKCRTAYLGPNSDIHDPFLSPLAAKLDSELPPALIFTAQCDPLRDEAKLYARELAKAGVEVNYTEYEGSIHGFLSFYMVLDEGKKSLRESRDFIHDHADLQK